MVHRSVALSLLGIACGNAAGPTASPSSDPAKPAATRDVPIAIRGGCGGPPIEATTLQTSRQAIAKFGGAVKAAARPLADYEPALPRATFERGIDLEDEIFGSEERPPNRIAAFRDRDERYTFVDVSLRPNSGSSDLESWAHEVLLENEPYATRADGLAMYRQILVYLSMWTDRHGRDNIEYAIVLKGCERGERYVRTTREGGQRLQIELLFNDETEPETAAKHLHGFFDAPLSSAPPPERTFAYGHKTNL